MNNKNNIKLIIGLGNYGSKFQNTRHNVGFLTIDFLTKKLNLIFKKENKLKSSIAFYKKKAIFLKPLTFMNLSGEAVFLVIKKYNISLENILIIIDDFSLFFNKIKIKNKGSSGGHKGLQNIIDILKSNFLKRIKIGIKNEEKDIILKDFVLQNFNSKELEKLNFIFQDIYFFILKIWFKESNFLLALNKFNNYKIKLNN